MTLEEVRALSWYEHDSIMEQLMPEFSEDVSEHEATPENLTGMGFSYEQVEG